MKKVVLGSMLLLAAMVPLRVAQGEPLGGIITSGDATLTFIDSPDNPGACELKLDGPGSRVAMTQSWWWLYNGPNHIPLQWIESSGTQPLEEDYAGNVATFSGVHGRRGFVLTYTLEDGENPGEAVLYEALSLRNLGQPGSLGPIAYANIDVGGSSGNDIAVAGLDGVVATDPLTGATVTIEYDQAVQLSGDEHFLVEDAIALESYLDSGGFLYLSDESSEFGPGDFGTAHQWLGGHYPGFTNWHYRTTTFAIPEPATVSLLALASLVLLHRRR